MSRWDASLDWGHDEAGKEKDEDEATAVVIAAALRELGEQRSIWTPLIHAVLSPLTAGPCWPPSLRSASHPEQR